MEIDRITHAREHQGSFSVGLEQRPRHPEAEPKGRFSRGLEQTGETHEKIHQGSFAVGIEQRPRHPEAEPKGRFSTGMEQTRETHEETHTRKRTSEAFPWGSRSAAATTRPSRSAASANGSRRRFELRHDGTGHLHSVGRPPSASGNTLVGRWFSRDNGGEP
jgi:hypothetical protein